jgi:hypothetical protein
VYVASRLQPRVARCDTCAAALGRHTPMPRGCSMSCSERFVKLGHLVANRVAVTVEINSPTKQELEMQQTRRKVKLHCSFSPKCTFKLFHTIRPTIFPPYFPSNFYSLLSTLNRIDHQDSLVQSIKPCILLFSHHVSRQN